ncbi:hypothetical protein GY45DRAFT_1329781 [Cubamyces sp. BRFM 1775]|nr:hypothetical protein GY45DRAFT_1329781 [Cubamyces sp. BRFM 1775]
MSTNTNVTIPGLFQFPPSLESELVAGRRRHDSEEMHLPYNHLEGIPEYYKQTGAFVARRLSTSMIASSSTAGGAGPSGRGQGFSSPVRHQSLTASGLRSNAIARPANPPREGTAPLGQRDAYPILHLQSHSHSHSHPYHLFLPNHLPQPSSLHAHAQSLSPPLLAAPPPPPSSASPPFASAPRMLAPPHGAHPHAPHTFAYPSADGDGDMYMNMRAASHEERYPSDDLAYPSASPPHFLATHAEEDVVKQEDPAQDEPMMWAHNAFYPPASSVESPYTEQLVDEPMEEPMYDVDVKSEPYNGYAHVGAVDGNVIDESWNNVLVSLTHV